MQLSVSQLYGNSPAKTRKIRYKNLYISGLNVKFAILFKFIQNEVTNICPALYLFSYCFSHIQTAYALTSTHAIVCSDSGVRDCRCVERSASIRRLAPTIQKSLALVYSKTRRLNVFLLVADSRNEVWNLDSPLFGLIVLRLESIVPFDVLLQAANSMRIVQILPTIRAFSIRSLSFCASASLSMDSPPAIAPASPIAASSIYVDRRTAK